jgi:hypothetical protein
LPGFKTPAQFYGSRANTVERFDELPKGLGPAALADGAELHVLPAVYHTLRARRL